MYGPSKNGQWYYFENYCASKLVLDDPTRCGLFYKLVKSIWIIAFGSKTGSNEHGNVPFSDFRFKLEIDSIRKKVELQKSRSNRAKIILFNAIISSFKLL